MRRYTQTVRGVLQHWAVFMPGSEFKPQECSPAENPEQGTPVKRLTVLSHLHSCEEVGHCQLSSNIRDYYYMWLRSVHVQAYMSVCSRT